MARRWHGVLTIQGELASGSDRRIFDLFTWRTPPLTLRVQTEDFGGHDGASPVATIEGVMLLGDGRRVWGWGTFSDTEPGQMAEQWVEEGVLRGVSVDPGEFTYVEEIVTPDGDVMSMEEVYELYALADEALDAGDEDEYARIMGEIDGLQWQLHFTSYEIAAATLVATPAFRDAKIALVADGEEPATDEATASKAADALLATAGPVASAAERLAALTPKASVADRLRSLAVGRAGTLLASGSPEGGRPRALFSPGRTIAAPGAVFEGVGTLRGARAGAHRASAVQTMRAAWFEPDDAVTRNRTPWTITDEGRIMGYLFSWASCHRSFGGSCVTPPRQTEFPDFHVGEARLDDGRVLSKADGTGVGVLTYADLHAGEGPADPAVLQRLMEDTGLQLGPVRLHADDYGVQCCGQLYDDVTPAQAARALAGYPSGDWRDVLDGQGWKLYGLHVVNTPGHPWRSDSESGARMVASMSRPATTSSCGCGGTEASTCGCSHDDEPVAKRISAASLADLTHLDTAMAGAGAR